MTVSSVSSYPFSDFWKTNPVPTIVGQIVFYSAPVLFHCVGTVAHSGVNGILYHVVSVIQQEAAKACGLSALSFGLHREVKKYHYSHKLIHSGAD